MVKQRKNKKRQFPRFIQHLHPPRIPAVSAKFQYTFGLGGLAFFSFLITLVTGVLLLFYYSPNAKQANATMQQIASVAAYGWYVRNLHYWAAQIMVFATLLHLVRIVFTGGYLNGRRTNWLIGMLLLILTYFVDFTGFTLRWDNESHWALVTGTNLIKTIPHFGTALYVFLVGGSEITGQTLLRMYAWHIFGLPFLISVLSIYHFWRIRKDGGISRRHDISAAKSIGRDELLRKETVFLLLISSLFSLLSVFFSPHLGVSPEKGLPVSHVHAPWIFLWIQFLLRYFPPFLAGIVLPVTILIWLSVLPYYDNNSRSEGIWFSRERQKIIFPVAGILFFIFMLSTLEAGK